MKLDRAAMNIVNQLYDLAEVPVDKRQAINDRSDEFIKKLLAPYFKKAAMWDKLEAEIEKYYPENEDDAPGDLNDIGETAATAFGFMYGPIKAYSDIEY